ncbi:MAG: sigma-70 family RNA polymerase sigma factor [Polyangiaceae bacterium]|nr:sigma-70 family RNA polymerase sigma factor [Polyangiaceae bacterium]
MLSDEATRAWVHRARRGEPAAFEALVRAYLRPAYAVALAIVGRPADAEDVAQDTLVLAFERLETCREPARFGAWLLQIARNQAKNWLDRRKLRDVPSGEGALEAVDPGAAPDASAERGVLLRALGALRPAEREVVLLHDLEGFTHGEIASALGISEVHSRQHLFQARQRLRAALGSASEGDT